MRGGVTLFYMNPLFVLLDRYRSQLIEQYERRELKAAQWQGASPSLDSGKLGDSQLGDS